MVWINLALLVAVIGLNVADGVFTWLSLRAGATELNKALAWLMDKAGVVPALALVKIIMIGILLAVSYLSWSKWYLTLFLLLAAAGYVLVVVNNVRIWRALSAKGTLPA